MGLPKKDVLGLELRSMMWGLKEQEGDRVVADIWMN